MQVPGQSAYCAKTEDVVESKRPGCPSGWGYLIADTQFSPFMYLVNTVQYDSVSRVLGFQARFRWIVKPGNDVFFDFEADRDETGFDLASTGGCLRFDLYVDGKQRADRVRFGPRAKTPGRIPAVLCP